VKQGRSGFVALVGKPNVGKSTLVNAMAGQKLAIVSPKPQTTRNRLRAIVNRPGAQLVLVDTPGLTEGGDALRQTLRRITGSAAADADVGLAMLEIRGIKPELDDMDRQVLAMAQRQGLVVVINKVDRLPDKAMLLPWMEVLHGATGGAVVIPVSARTGDGLEVLERELISRLPEGPFLFPEDMVTDEAERAIVGELVREQILLQTHEEVPHAAAVVIESFEDGRGDDDGLCRIEGRIYIERDSQKGILVGKKGSRIKSISEAARHEIEALLGARVYLRLTVHVSKDWRKNERAVLKLGYGDNE